MVTPAHALLGRTHGHPYPPGAFAATAWADMQTGHPTLAGWPTDDANDEGWRAAVVPSTVLVELVRSPTYITWQGDEWLFHCGRVMRYGGRWGRADFESAAGGEVPSAFAMGAAGVPDDVWETLGRGADDSAVSVYMFDCIACGAHRGHWDID